MAEDEYAPEALEDGENEDRDEIKYEPSKQTIIALIDASPAMLEEAPAAMDEDEEGDGARRRSYLSVAMDAVVRLMRWRIMHAPNDEIGVMFYGAAKANVEGSFASVYELAPLAGPEVATIHRLQEFTDAAFREDVGSREEAGAAAAGNANAAEDLKMGLWAAMQKLDDRTKTSKTTLKSIFVFTCNEDPTGVDPKLREMVDQRLDLLHGRRIRLDVFPLLALRRPFDMAAFWNHAIQMASGRGDESDGEEGGEGGGSGWCGRPAALSLSDVAAYLAFVASRARASRANARLHMTLGAAPEGQEAAAGVLRIAVQVFSLLRPAGRPPKTRVTRDAFQEVKSSTAFMHSDGSIMSDANKRAIHTKTRGGSDRIRQAIFDNSELETVRAPRKEAGLVVLGFKPASALAPQHVLAPAKFVYPDEGALRGSTTAFIALWRAMRDKRKVAIARLVMRRGTAPALVALAPQVEEVDADGTQVTPPGLHMLQLPWRDELRFPERGGARGGFKSDDKPQATEEQIAAAEALVSAVALAPDFPSQLRDIPNPSLARHYDVLELMALQLDREEVAGHEVEDDTLPDDDTLREHGPTFAAFSKAVYGTDGAGAAGKTAGAKRKTAGPEPHVAELYAERDWAALANSDQLARLTNDNLKVYLRYHQLTLGGNKADLLARIKAHVNQAQA